MMNLVVLALVLASVEAPVARDELPVTREVRAGHAIAVPIETILQDIPIPVLEMTRDPVLIDCINYDVLEAVVLHRRIWESANLRFGGRQHRSDLKYTMRELGLLGNGRRGAPNKRMLRTAH